MCIEPEVQDLINFLKKLGCKINQSWEKKYRCIWCRKIKINVHKVIFDRIEAGTYIIAAALTNGRLKITNINPKIMSTEISLLT